MAGRAKKHGHNNFSGVHCQEYCRQMSSQIAPEYCRHVSPCVFIFSTAVGTAVARVIAELALIEWFVCSTGQTINHASAKEIEVSANSRTEHRMIEGGYEYSNKYRVKLDMF